MVEHTIQLDGVICGQTKVVDFIGVSMSTCSKSRWSNFYPPVFFWWHFPKSWPDGFLRCHLDEAISHWVFLRIHVRERKPIPSMYGIFTHIWLIFMVNVGKYTIHGSYGKGLDISVTLNLGCIWPWQMLCPLMIPNQLACVSASASGVPFGRTWLRTQIFRWQIMSHFEDLSRNDMSQRVLNKKTTTS